MTESNVRNHIIRIFCSCNYGNNLTDPKKDAPLQINFFCSRSRTDMLEVYCFRINDQKRTKYTCIFMILVIWKSTKTKDRTQFHFE